MDDLNKEHLIGSTGNLKSIRQVIDENNEKLIKLKNCCLLMDQKKFKEKQDLLDTIKAKDFEI